jgi:hypothetical protein
LLSIFASSLDSYIGSDKAIADLPLFGKDNLTSIGGQATYWFWRSASIVRYPPPRPDLLLTGLVLLLIAAPDSLDRLQ